MPPGGVTQGQQDTAIDRRGKRLPEHPQPGTHGLQGMSGDHAGQFNPYNKKVGRCSYQKRRNKGNTKKNYQPRQMVHFIRLAWENTDYKPVHISKVYTTYTQRKPSFEIVANGFIRKLIA
ncbi:hypothetical protein FACS1894130_03310 [Spirochaetia bacterium]|nr:hypothetical protein FACS1894130_03310 [Spirochaetia bacterium]